MRTHKERIAAYFVATTVALVAGAVYVSHNLGSGFSLSQASGLAVIGHVFAFDGVEFWAFFAALFAIMNPLIAVPLFVHVTRRRNTADRHRLALVCSATVFLALVTSALFGQQILNFFAIGIGSFRIAGGVIVLLMGLAMMRSENSNKEADGPGENLPKDDGDSQAICPIAIPLLAGPGAIATMILRSQVAETPAGYGMIGCVIAAMVALTYLALRSASPIAQSLGPTGLMVVTRIIGMIVAAIAIDMMVIGLRLSFPSAL